MKRPRQCGPAHASKAVRSRTSFPLKNSAPAAPLLDTLDDDLLLLVLEQCMSPALAQVCATCSRLHQLASDAARLALLARRPNLLPPAGMKNNWVRALRTDELLLQSLGQPRDAQRSWRSEYIALQTEDFRLYQLLTGEGWRGEHIAFSGDFFGAGGERSLHACMRTNADDIEWRVNVAGWTREHAEALTLLMTSGAAMSRSLSRIRTFAGRPRGRPAVWLGKPVPFPFSVWSVVDALGVAAYRRGSTLPPNLYSPLALPAEAWGTGPGCLLEEDAAWAPLLRPKVKIGITFRTSAFVNAEEASRFALGSGRGFLIHNDDEERPVHAPEIVCFVNRPADGSGMHSLLQDAPGEGLRSRSGPGYTLPPFSTVKLEAIHEPGQWRVLGKTMMARLFTCGVTYAL